MNASGQTNLEAIANRIEARIASNARSAGRQIGLYAVRDVGQIVVNDAASILAALRAHEALVDALKVSRRYVARVIDVHDEGHASHLEQIDAALAGAAS